ncbi:MAG: hypothetical protein EHM87_11600 [Burkholderiales bacterium]|nr:MAG: hypothetical protein EHM87_11600 [Burkholderiales bacterium]
MSKHPELPPEPRPEPGPDPLPQPPVPDAAAPATPTVRINAVAAPLPRKTHVRELPTLGSMRLTTELREEGIDLRSLEDRFPHVLNQVSAEWDTPKAALEVLDALLIDQRGGRQGFPDDALAALLALRRCCVERIARAARR